MLYYNPPVALVVLYDNDLIRRANDQAVAMGFLSCTTLANCIADFMEKFVDHVRHHQKHFYLAWNFSMGECGASFEENSSELYVWPVEALGQLVLANQIRRVKQHESLKMRPVNQLIVTAAGYS